MKRFVALGIVVVGLVALATAIVPSFVSADFLKQRLAERIASVTGRNVVLGGEPMLSVYPHLAISVGDVTIANPEGMGEEPFIAAARATARLRLTPLLVGRIEFDEFELTEPRIRLTIDGEGRSNWQLQRRAGTTADGAGIGGRFGRLKVTNGTIVYDNLAADRHEEMTAFTLDVAWPDTAKALSGTGSLQWRGETLEFNGAIVEPLKLAEGSPVRFAIAATPLRVAFNGTLTSLNDYRLVGDATVTTPSMRRTIEWLAVPTGTGSILGAASIAGTVDWLGSTISFTKAEIELDGNVGEGTLSVNFAPERPLVQGTLAFAKLDLSPYLEAMRASLMAEGPWLVAPTSLPVADVLDADVRVSTGQILAGAVRIDKAAIVGTIKDGSATIDVGEAGFYGGSLAAHLTAAMLGDTLSTSAEVQLTGVATGAALTDLAAVSSLDGTVTATVNISGGGRNWGEFAQAVRGTMAFDIANGSLTGLDIDEIAAMTPKVWPAPMLAGNGSTSFTSLAGKLALADGGVETDDLIAEGGHFRIAVNGWGSLLGGRIDATAMLAMVGGDGETHMVPLAVGGTWHEPAFVFDRDRIQGTGEASPDEAGAAPRG